MKDVAEAGGWRDPVTLLKCYQQADDEAVANVVLGVPKLYRSGIANGGEVTQQVTLLGNGAEEEKRAMLHLA